MKKYALAYRIGFTPWERYPEAAAASIRTLLDREEAARSRPLGRAVDLGCGRGHCTRELASRGWEAVGVDHVPQAIDAAERGGVTGAGFVVADVTELASAGLGWPLNGPTRSGTGSGDGAPPAEPTGRYAWTLLGRVLGHRSNTPRDLPHENLSTRRRRCRRLAAPAVRGRGQSCRGR